MNSEYGSMSEHDVLVKLIKRLQGILVCMASTWILFLVVFFVLAIGSGCASYNERYDPQMDLSLGATLHEEYRNNRTAAIGQVAVTQKVVPGWDWLRAGFSHESDPSTIKDNGVTWFKGTLRFGAN